MAFNIEELQALESQLSQLNLDAQGQVFTGSEVISGTSSDDNLIGSANSEAIAGLSGSDSLSGKSGGDTLLGGEGQDRILSNGGAALLIGGEGDDSLSAETFSEAANENSTLLGDQGMDSLVGSTKEDLLFGGSEGDQLNGSHGNDSLNGGSGSDTLNGGNGDDLVFGDLNNDQITGGDGNDQVDGGEGNDLFFDTAGNDRLTSGAGADAFLLLPGTGQDTVVDFQPGQDRLILVDNFPQRGLTFDQLEITENNGNAIISIADTGEVLLELAGTSASAISATDFSTISMDTTADSMSNDQMGVDLTNTVTELLAEFSTKGNDSLYNQAQVDQSTPQNQNTAADQPEPLATETEVGAVTSQGVEAMNVDQARDRFDVNGEGITIGVISDSFDRSLNTEISANDDALSGDLPGEGNPQGYNQPVTILDDSADNSNLFEDGGVTDEGRAMIQLIHDVAPSAELVFHQVGENEQELTGAINDLVDAGADIIVDDFATVGEPFFQDGQSSQAIDDAVAKGVSYFSAAGNFANNSYESDFRAVESGDNSTNSIPGLEGYVFHDFNPEAEVDIFQGITLEAGKGITLDFQWDQPFASAGGTGASNDLDIFLLDSESKIVAASTESNVGKDAVEALKFTSEAGGEYNLVVGQDVSAGGESPGFIKYIDVAGGAKNTEYFTGGSTIFGHVNAVGSEAVGAASYQNTPAFGSDPVIEDFSSLGGTPILFDPQGNPLAEPEMRQQPRITAPDNTNTTFFPSGDNSSDLEGDSFPNFSGTSAAAPHAAGVAALLLEANPGATPEQIYQALEASALDMENPYTSSSDPGYDAASGYGLIQADRALEEILETSTQV